MMTGDDWEIEFYVDARGNSPVEEFLDSLDLKTRARFLWSLDQLRKRNVQARFPLVRHLEEHLWELREESRANTYRVIYCFFTGRRIILLHGFQKKTQKTPERELATARRRYEDWLLRQESRRGRNGHSI
jgi:phage-related protein